MKSRKFVPQKARPNTKNYKVNWTSTGTESVWYRHLKDGTVVYGTLSKKSGKQVWHKLEATSIRAARREADLIHGSDTEKPTRSGGTYNGGIPAHQGA